MSSIGNICTAVITFVETPKNKQLIKEFLPLLMAVHEQGPMIGFACNRANMAYQLATAQDKTNWGKSVEAAVLVATTIIGLKYPRAQLLLSSTSQIVSFVSKVLNTNDRKLQAIATLKMLPLCIYLASLQTKKGNSIVLYMLSRLLVSRIVESMRAAQQ